MMIVKEERRWPGKLLVTLEITETDFYLADRQRTWVLWERAGPFQKLNMIAAMIAAEMHKERL